MPYTYSQIIHLYNSVYKNYINFYTFSVYPRNYSRLMSCLNYYLKQSCAKLLARKYNLSSRAKVYKKFGHSFFSGANLKQDKAQALKRREYDNHTDPKLKGVSIYPSSARTRLTDQPYTLKTQSILKKFFITNTLAGGLSRPSCPVNPGYALSLVGNPSKKSFFDSHTFTRVRGNKNKIIKLP